MMLIDIDDERNCYAGMDGEYERWNIDPNVLEEGRQRALLTDSEPQEDAVSRKDVIDLYKRGAEIIAKAKGISVEDMLHNGLDALMNLPPVTPKRKTGKWILHPEQRNVYGGKYIECPECGEKYMVQYIEDEKFCRSCGADMGGEQNEPDKQTD